MVPDPAPQVILRPPGVGNLHQAEREPCRVAGDKILVTGASGFVGSAVASALAASGYSVRALLRSASPRTNLSNLDVEIVEGDMCEPASVARAVRYGRGEELTARR